MGKSPCFPRPLLARQCLGSSALALALAQLVAAVLCRKNTREMAFNPLCFNIKRVAAFWKFSSALFHWVLIEMADETFAQPLVKLKNSV